MSIAATSGARASVPVSAQPTTGADKAAVGKDPLAGQLHVFGKPSSIGAVLGMGGAAAAITGGMTYAVTRSFSTPLAPLKAGLVVGGAALAGGLIGVALNRLMPGPKVGIVHGEKPFFVKTGTEPYNSTCTDSIRVNVGDTDGDGYDNYRTSTRTYDCVKVRDVGHYEWRPASGDLRLGVRIGDRAGYETADAARAAAAGTSALVVERPDGRFYAYKKDVSGVSNINTTVMTVPGISG
ncbi:MAG: hypothetical protein KDC46_05270 [Thermoleophilia bacterium]|nr:hypothetical protein [Thermoleophilia bacterium]